MPLSLCKYSLKWKILIASSYTSSDRHSLNYFWLEDREYPAVYLRFLSVH